MHSLRLAAALAAALIVPAIPTPACEALQRAFRVDPPPQGAGGAVFANTTCSRAELRMFEKNLVALQQAEPVSDPTLLHGTWLSDNVVGWIIGVTVPGQDVLRFAAGSEPDALHVEQYWMKAVRPDTFQMPWEPSAGYTGLLAGGVLVPARDGSYRPADLDAIRYTGTTFEFERSYDLFVKAQVNYFEWDVRFALDGDTLVLRAQRFTHPVRELETVEATYTRVADRAPDRAMLLVLAMEVSQGWYFDCFAHQLTDGQGPLIDAMAPVTPEEMETMLGGIVEIRNERAALAEAVKAGPVLNATSRLRVLSERLIERITEPRHADLMKRLHRSDLGCVRLD